MTLEGYAAKQHALTVTRTYCEVCGNCYMLGDGYHMRCPSCFPGDPTYEEILTNRDEWPGHAFVWDQTRGKSGRWILLTEFRKQPLVALTQLAAYAHKHNIQDSAGIMAHSAIMKECDRLRELAAGVSEPMREAIESERKRACELADECQRLRDALMRKRAECDELRSL